MTNIEKYFQIIDCRRNSVPDTAYVERHHIVPKSLCPLMANVESNLVKLTASEHFMVHYYLWKYCKEEKKDSIWERKMWCALIKMYSQVQQYMSETEAIQASIKFSEIRTNCCLSGKNNPMYGKNWQDYSDAETIKQHRINVSNAVKKWHSEHVHPMQGKHHDEDAIKSISKTMSTLKWWNNGIHQVRSVECPEGYVHGRLKLSEEHKMKIRKNSPRKYGKDNPMFGKHLTLEQRRKMSDSRKGRHWFNNGVENRFCVECPKGFLAGRLPFRKLV